MLRSAVVALTLVAAVGGATGMRVTMRQGIIEGSKDVTAEGFVYYSFHTIPYAEPPVGSLRFKNPKPAPKWHGVRNGSLPFPKCPQSSIFKNEEFSFDGQEDCLYLNVFTTRPYPSDLPVMVYIHGGALVAGSALGPSPPMVAVPLLKKDVVVVAMNYRLGALGFLSTEDSVMPGNMGLKDQTMALQWVQDNIQSFGGDPRRVTIFGVSSGGFSCHLHTLSKSSKGLFQRAILQSGSALTSGMMPPARKGALAIAKALNCSSEDSYDVLECFTKASVGEIIQYQTTLSEFYDVPLTVGATVDGEFLEDWPAALVKSGEYNVPDIMVGWTKDDGDLITAGLFSSKGEAGLMAFNQNIGRLAQVLFSMHLESNSLYHTKRLLLNYMDDLNITLEDEPNLTHLLRDFAYQMPGVQTAEFHSRKQESKTYAYRLDHCLEKSQYTIFTNSYIQRKMAGHGDDNRYLFHAPPPLGPMTRLQDLHVREIMATLWTNFAYFGNPTYNGTLGFRWSTVKPNQPVSYLSITTTPSMQIIDEKKRQFWNSLHTRNTLLLYPERFTEHYEACEPSVHNTQVNVEQLNSCSSDLKNFFLNVVTTLCNF